MPSRPDSSPKLASAVETEPVRGYTYDEGMNELLAHAHRMLYFFHIHNRRRLDRYDLNVPVACSTHFKFLFTLASGFRSRPTFLYLDIATHDLTRIDS